MKRKTNEFWAITGSGKKYLIYEFSNFIDAGTFQNPKATIPGLKEFRTSDGMAVNMVNEETYEIVQLDVIAKKIST